MPIRLNSSREQNSNERTRNRTDAEVRRARIRQLNDALRRTGQGGHMMVTSGIEALPDDQQAAIAAAVASFDALTKATTRTTSTTLARWRSTACGSCGKSSTSTAR